MAILVDHQNVNLPNGNREFGPFNVPDNATFFKIGLDACTDADPTIWPNAATTILAEIWMSYDGGATFPRRCIFFTGVGGIHIAPNGAQAPDSYAVGHDPTPGEQVVTGRKARANVTVTNGPLKSRVTVEVS